MLHNKPCEEYMNHIQPNIQHYYMSNLGFLAGSIVKTDQEMVPIENINTEVHTIDGKKIKAVYPVISANDYIMHIKQSAIAENVPSQDTYLTYNQELVFLNEVVPSIYLLNKYATNHALFPVSVQKIDYRGQLLYNILIDSPNQEEVYINHLLCKTLDPKAPLVYLHNSIGSFTLDVQQEFIREHNEMLLRDIQYNPKSCKPTKNTFFKQFV